jgi:hypothetical protein
MSAITSIETGTAEMVGKAAGEAVAVTVDLGAVAAAAAAARAARSSFMALQ